MTTKKIKNIKENWEKEFDKKFGEEIVESNWLDCPCCGRKEHRIKDTDIPVKNFWFYQPIKVFIRQTREQARQEGIEETIEKVDKMRKKPKDIQDRFNSDRRTEAIVYVGYNDAIDDVLSELKKKEGK